MDENNKNNGKSEIESFLERNKERLEKFRRINEEVEEEMEELSFRKAQTPELGDVAFQVEITNRFLADNPDVPRVTVDDKDE